MDGSNQAGRPAGPARLADMPIPPGRDTVREATVGEVLDRAIREQIENINRLNEYRKRAEQLGLMNLPHRDLAEMAYPLNYL